MRLLTLMLAAALLSPAAQAQTTGPQTGVLGTWQGRYVCNQGDTALTLTVRPGPTPDDVTALFRFGPSPANPGVPEGCFTMLGRYDGDTRRISLVAGTWLQRPPNYLTVDLQGNLNAKGNRLSGQVLGPGCTEFEVRRTSPLPTPRACLGTAAISAR